MVSEQPRVFLSPRALEMYQREASLEGEPLYEALEKEMALRNCGVSSGQTEAYCAHFDLEDEIRLVHGRGVRAPGRPDRTGPAMGGFVVVENGAGHTQKQVSCEEEQICLTKRFYPIPKPLPVYIK